jgi:hypothetical protein
MKMNGAPGASAGTAVSQQATDRRPIKMRDFAILKNYTQINWPTPTY